MPSADQSQRPIPFAEPPWLQGLPSPYYTESHRKWQKTCREFISKHLTQHAYEWEANGDVPEHVFGEFAKEHMLIPNLPAPLPVQELKNAGIHELPGGLKVEDFDYLHLSIYVSEMNMSGLSGPATSLTAGMAFGTPCIIKFGNEQLKKNFLPDIFNGKKRMCIAITEPDAGSDVANVHTTARKTEDGKYYIVDGAKKWITNGIWADYAAMTVRTGGSGPGGLSMILCPLKGHPGVEMRRLKVQGSQSAGTTYIELDEVKVPVENLIGEEGQGMKYVMTNFNHERLIIAIGATTQARVALSDTFGYCMKREAFGNSLLSQPVVRHRLAKAGAELESMWSWVESFVYQMCHLKKQDADVELGGLTALAKAKAGMVLNECAQTAVLLHGGNGITTSGQGEVAERLYREVMVARIPGGSEDVLLDLAIRQLWKNFQKANKSKI